MDIGATPANPESTDRRGRSLTLAQSAAVASTLALMHRQ